MVKRKSYGGVNNSSSNISSFRDLCHYLGTIEFINEPLPNTALVTDKFPHVSFNSTNDTYKGIFLKTNADTLPQIALCDARSCLVRLQ